MTTATIRTYEAERVRIAAELEAGTLTQKEHDKLSRDIDRAQIKYLERRARTAASELILFREECDRKRARNHLRRKLKQSVGAAPAKPKRIRRWGQEMETA